MSFKNKINLNACHVTQFRTFFFRCKGLFYKRYSTKIKLNIYHALLRMLSTLSHFFFLVVWCQN